jgi:hypothetical protein
MQVLKDRVLRAVLEAPARADELFAAFGRRPRADGWVPGAGFLTEQLRPLLAVYGRNHQSHLAQMAVRDLEAEGLVEVRRETRGEGKRAFKRIGWVRLTDAGQKRAATLPPLSAPVAPLPPPLAGPGVRKHRERLEREAREQHQRRDADDLARGVRARLPAVPMAGVMVVLVTNDGEPLQISQTGGVPCPTS